MLAIVLICLLFAMCSWAVGKPKGRATQGFFLGLLLGLVGLIITACLKPVSSAAQR